MTTVGFSFTKINAERKIVSDQNIRIENNVGVVKVEETDVLDPKKTLLKFEFSFICKYEPGLGAIELGGELIEMFDKDMAAKVLDGWKAEKKIHPDVMARILNSILARANVEAIIISRDLGLPSPVKLPLVEMKPKDMPIVKPDKVEDAKKELKEKLQDKPVEKASEKKADKKK